MSDIAPLGDGALAPGAGLSIGTWNVSGWSAAKAAVAAQEVAMDILAVQETHLAAIPLEWAHTTSQRLELSLHHGRPVRPMVSAVHGRSCGVGFLSRRGLALAAALPVGAAWRRLHAMGRLHAVRLAPRTGLPKGLLLLSVYAPLREHDQRSERASFDLAMMECLHTLDMQVPTLVMGDFNGSLMPAQDYHSLTGARRAACPLLAHLLGPGAPWVDVHRVLLPTPLPWTYQAVGPQGKLSASRIDLILANHLAMALVQSASVLEVVRDGGHSPVCVTLKTSAIALDWRSPKPRLPPLLQLSSEELAISEDWVSLLDRWVVDPAVRGALDPSHPHSLDSLSQALHAALQTLVRMAGGWATRPSVRRSAYDSNALRSVRRQLQLLNRLDSAMRRAGSGFAGSWPYPWLQLLDDLQAVGLTLPRTTIPALQLAVVKEQSSCREKVARLSREMRQQRHARWRDSVPILWRDRPGVVYHWLHAIGAPWGTTPILEEDGRQCTTVESVDAAVRRYWVDRVLRQHCSVDGESRWETFLGSQFAVHIPVLEWPAAAWTGDRVRRVLRRMREGAAPGVVGVTLAVWKSLPHAWSTAVARLLAAVEEQGRWPTEWLDAYVTMIPKSAGGSRPQDQRPITVLEVMYRIWSKGVVLDWSRVLQRDFLGQAAMGFRAQAGALHLAQLLADLIVLQEQRGEALWLSSFDVEKCYDSLPWWAVFGVLRHSGVRPHVVECFQSFYAALRRRFRYGQVDGEVWAAANGLAQGCPASPDLLNMLFEAFHRWAQAQGYGVEVAGFRIPSTSFADDLVLVSASKEEMEQLVAAYLHWCALLGVKVTKVQAWTNLASSQELQVNGSAVRTSPTIQGGGHCAGPA